MQYHILHVFIVKIIYTTQTITILVGNSESRQFKASGSKSHHGLPKLLQDKLQRR